jgi:hypothetical protein
MEHVWRTALLQIARKVPPCGGVLRADHFPVSGRLWSWIREWAPLPLLVAVVLLSRLPFLGAGYGLHWDAWGNAKIAQEIAETGRYTMARPPGAPVYELTTALLSWGGPAALNGLSALAGAMSVAIFALLARRVGCRDWLLAAAAFGFCAVFYISSVTSKDFTMACAFVLLSALFVTKGWPLRAGIALGLAMGCRLTSGAILLPLALALFHYQPRETRFRQLVLFVASTSVVAVLVFIPAFARYGVSFLTYFEPVYYPSWLTVASRGSIDVWGVLGCVGLVAAAAGAFCFRRSITSISGLAAYPALAWGAVVLIYAALYVAFPDQAAYFLPAVPFTILILARFSPRRLFQTFCIVTIVSAFVGWDNGSPAPGPILQDRTQRLRTMANIRNFYEYARTIEGRNVFVIGGFFHAIGLIAPESNSGHFVYLLTAKELTDFRDAGFTIYYLPAIRQFEYDVHGIDLAFYGGIDLVAFRESHQSPPLASALP